MIGWIYLILCFTVGWCICSSIFPGLRKLVNEDYLKRTIQVSPYFILLPAWFVTGTLSMSWTTYLIAYIFRSKSEPLFYANLIVMPIALGITIFNLLIKWRNKNSGDEIYSKDLRMVRREAFLVFSIILLASILMWTTFFIHGDRLYVGVSVFSDFSPHIGMIRSFSYGNNFPTTYSHYAGEDIKYHFMFQFLVGNLEFLGMRLDYAFNVPSILSFITAFFLLYLLAIKITGKIGAGILACLFFAFRSSKTLFTYLSELPEHTNILKVLAENQKFISDTPNEDWGLWNLNVYCNQRHLAFGLTVMFFVIILMLPNLYEMFENLKQYKIRQKKHLNNKDLDFTTNFTEKLSFIFFTKESWFVKDYKLAIALGILLGSLAFFHGAAVIGCLSILFIIAITANRRLEFLIIAIITYVLSTLQSLLFVKGSVVSTQFLFGFIAENKTLFGVASYLERLLGILPIVLLVAFCIEKAVSRYILIAFTAPLVFAFTISLTVDVTVNHKYIMMSCILLGIFAADLCMLLLKQKDLSHRLVAMLLIVMLTATGIYDFRTVLAKNTPDSAIVLDLEDPLTNWIKENSNSQDIFLTSNYSLNQVVLGGAMLYEGWTYYAWSAGYDTDKRFEQVKLMYEAQSPQELDTLVEQNNIRYIIVDYDNRYSKDYDLNEANIEATYECVYSQGDGDLKTSVFDTEKPIDVTP